MRIELDKEQIMMLNELCFSELLEMGKIHHNKFIDKVQVETYENKLRELLDILTVD